MLTRDEANGLWMRIRAACLTAWKIVKGCFGRLELRRVRFMNRSISQYTQMQMQNAQTQDGTAMQEVPYVCVCVIDVRVRPELLHVLQYTPCWTYRTSKPWCLARDRPGLVSP